MFMLFFDRSKKILIFWSLPDAYFFSRPSQILFTFWSEPALIPHFFYLPNHSSYIFLLRATFGSIQLFTFSSGSEPHSLSFLILDYLSKPHLNVCSSIFLEVLPNCPYTLKALNLFHFGLISCILLLGVQIMTRVCPKSLCNASFYTISVIAKIAPFSAKKT